MRATILPTALEVAAPRLTEMVPGLTSIRGLAAWWVVMFHFAPWLPKATPAAVLVVLNRGYLGVDLFFLLSGYVIALNYASSMTKFNVSHSIRFLWLRVARIYPLHLLMLLSFLPLALNASYFGDSRWPPHDFDMSYFFMSLVLIQNWGLTTHVAWNCPAWSISVEWLAYIMFPLMIYFARRPLRNRSICWAMALISLALLAAVETHFTTPRYVPTPATIGPLRGLLEFWAGVCLFHARGAGRHDRNMGPVYGLILCAACCCIWVFLGVPNYQIMPIAFLFLVWALSYPVGLLARIMNTRLIMYLGTISYSTYLLHWLILDGAIALLPPNYRPFYLFPVFLATTFFLSAPLYRFIEMPGRRALRRVNLRALSRTMLMRSHQARI